MTTATATPDTWIVPTPDGWLAGSDTFPRIAVTGRTEGEALALLDERRAWWQSLPEPDLHPERPDAGDRSQDQPATD